MSVQTSAPRARAASAASATSLRALPRLADGVDDELRHAVPEGICRTFRVLPYHEHDGRVLVAASDADDASTEQVVAERLGRPVVLVRHTVAEITAVVDEAYPDRGSAHESAEARRARMQMAQMLTRSELISAEQLRLAMLEYARTGDPLEEILVASGAINEDVRVAALSEMHQLQRVGLDGFEPDRDLARRLPEPLARTWPALPVAEADGEVLVAVARPLDAGAAVAVEEALGRPVRQLLANRTDLDRLLQRVHGADHADAAVRQLLDRRPDQSAHVAVTGAQRAVLAVAAVGILASLVLWPTAALTVLVALAGLLYVAATAYRLRLGVRGLGRLPSTAITAADVAALDERTLPVITVLVPLDHEPAAVPGLVETLDGLDYPRTRLDVRLLCAADDVETAAAVIALDLPPHQHLVLVPDRRPRTRARMLDHGLRLAAGTYVVVHDAGDRPDPDQLKRAVIALDRAPDDVVCGQARLDATDAGRTLLGAWSATERAVESELVRPALAASGAPMPLGRTSYHVETRALRELGGWDPFNLAADADLGIRLHREGLRTVVVDATTATATATAETRGRFGAWMRERARETEGHLQTWLVHARQPLRLLAQTGPWGFASFHLTMAATFVLLLNPVLWVLVAAQVVAGWTQLGGPLPAAVAGVPAVLLLLGNAVHVHLQIAGALRRGRFGLVRTALLAPLPWALASVAAWSGLLHLLTGRRPGRSDGGVGGDRP